MESDPTGWSSLSISVEFNPTPDETFSKTYSASTMQKPNCTIQNLEKTFRKESREMRKPDSNWAYWTRSTKKNRKTKTQDSFHVREWMRQLIPISHLNGTSAFNQEMNPFKCPSVFQDFLGALQSADAEETKHRWAPLNLNTLNPNSWLIRKNHGACVAVFHVLNLCLIQNLPK